MRLRWLLALLCVLHAGLGASLGLSVDEAHYALYAAHPALSYFDHPPLVGWVQWPLVALHAPDSVLRLLPGLLWLATVLLVWRVTLLLSAQTAHPQRAACAAVLALLLAPLLHILGIGLLPDTLLMLWSVALLWQTLRLLDAAQAKRPAAWLLLGLLLGFFAIPFAVLALLSGGGSSLPHWTAPAWVALAPFVGIGLARSTRHSAVCLLAGLQALACLVLPALMLTGGMPFLAGQTASAEASDAPNPFADLHGWNAAGQRAAQLAAEQGLPAVAVQNWTLASRLGWYARPLPVQVLEDRFDQFDLWAAPLPVGGSALLVDWSQLPYLTPLGPHGFAACKLLDTLAVQRLGYALAQFDFYACSGWAGDPQPRLKPAAPMASPAPSTPFTPSAP
ncbi:MAG: glycosyltransferase family 39 protein [Rhodoferax sp.]|nr:glycosyltransferase family 39 protein [Rhodoferax sp.]